jgi:hypothetical protein
MCSSRKSTTFPFEPNQLHLAIAVDARWLKLFFARLKENEHDIASV